jgi:hypothetical protein
MVDGVEGALIALAAWLLGAHGLGVWIPMAVALIVGLHFFPMAPIWENSLFYWSGAASVLVVFGCLLISDMRMRGLSVGLMMAGVIWGTALWMVRQSFGVGTVVASHPSR